MVTVNVIYNRRGSTQLHIILRGRRGKQEESGVVRGDDGAEWFRRVGKVPGEDGGGKVKK